MRRNQTDLQTPEEKYVDDTLRRVNEKYKTDIVFVSNISEMEQYIKNNPSKNKIGFLIKPPWYMQDRGHFSPIYFERVGKTENFMQCDTVGSVYLLPESEDPTITRKQYYSPFQRQVNDVGCFEDSVTILRKCFQEKDMISFCYENSVKDEEIKIPSEDKKSKHWMYKSGNADLKSSSREPVAQFHKLTTLPARFLTNIEHYATMRHFREKEPEKFNMPYNDHETVLQHIQRKGILRSQDKHAPQDESKKDDVKGQDFTSRKRRYHKKQKHQVFQKKMLLLN
ncbi:MAG: hypothetical protein NTZ67_07785 [Gammaproteobacteria bacterium]|nr:hypothetical protein [Gammaproteobacteria bacterium]